MLWSFVLRMLSFYCLLSDCAQRLRSGSTWAHRSRKAVWLRHQRFDGVSGREVGQRVWLRFRNDEFNHWAVTQGGQGRRQTVGQGEQVSRKRTTACHYLFTSNDKACISLLSLAISCLYFQGNCASALDYKAKFESDLLKMNASFVCKQAYVPSFAEMYPYRHRENVKRSYVWRCPPWRTTYVIITSVCTKVVGDT